MSLFILDPGHMQDVETYVLRAAAIESYQFVYSRSAEPGSVSLWRCTKRGKRKQLERWDRALGLFIEAEPIIKVLRAAGVP